MMIGLVRIRQDFRIFCLVELCMWQAKCKRREILDLQILAQHRDYKGRIKTATQERPYRHITYHVVF